MTPPSVFEADGHSRELYPQEARLRSLTYASPVFIGEKEKKEKEKKEDEEKEKRV